MHHRIVLLHGWGADADNLRPVGEALSNGHPSLLDVICLSAPEARPDASGRQWYDLFPPRWDRVPEAVTLLRRRLLELADSTHPLEKTVLMGFSQGGAMSLDSGCTLPLAGVISCSGYPHPDWQPPHDHPPVLLLHGTEDQVVPVTAMESIWERLEGDRRQRFTFQDGHTIPHAAMHPMQNFLSRVL